MSNYEWDRIHCVCRSFAFLHGTASIKNAYVLIYTQQSFSDKNKLLCIVSLLYLKYFFSFNSFIHLCICSVLHVISFCLLRGYSSWIAMWASLVVFTQIVVFLFIYILTASNVVPEARPWTIKISFRIRSFPLVQLNSKDTP